MKPSAHSERCVKFLVVKAVVNFADLDKGDSFQKYAAQISAAWAYAFLWRYTRKVAGTSL